MILDLLMHSLGSYRLLDVPEVREKHEKMKDDILNRLKLFKEKNPTTPFVVLGSSNLILQDEIVLSEVTDVDIYCYSNKISNIQTVDGVDILINPFVHYDYSKRITNIYGYDCLSKIDTMIASVSGLRKGKVRNLKYLYVLLAYDDNLKKQFFKLLNETELNYKDVPAYNQAVKSFKALYYEKSRDEIQIYEDKILLKEKSMRQDKTSNKITP